MITQKQQRAYDNLDPDKKRTYEDPKTAELVLLCAKRQNIGSDATYKFASYVGDVILGINRIDSLPEYLNSLGISADQAITLIKETESLLNGLGVTKPDTKTEEAVKPLRTMEMDAKKVHGYGALPDYGKSDEEVVYRSSQANVMTPNYTEAKPIDRSEQDNVLGNRG